MAQPLIDDSQIDLASLYNNSTFVNGIADNATFISNLATDSTLLAAFASGDAFNESYAWDTSSFFTSTTYSNTSGGPIMVAVSSFANVGGFVRIEEKPLASGSFQTVIQVTLAGSANSSDGFSAIILNNRQWRVFQTDGTHNVRVLTL